jgi:nucleoside-diphosphate-sugar epimerase
MVAWNHRPAAHAGRQPYFEERKILRALVLGGDGFFGLHPVNALPAQGAQGRVLERPYRTHMPLIPEHPAPEWQEGDFGNAQNIQFAPQNIDAEFHPVSTTQPPNDDSCFDVENNLAATSRLPGYLHGPKKPHARAKT